MTDDRIAADLRRHAAEARRQNDALVHIGYEIPRLARRAGEIADQLEALARILEPGPATGEQQQRASAQR